MSTLAKYIKKRLFFTTTFLVSLLGASGQITFRGVVSDDHGQPLAGASVWLVSATDTIGRSKTTTKINGAFQLQLSSDTLATVHISYIGYQSLSQIISFDKDAHPDTFRLQPTPKSLPTIQIEGIKPFMKVEGDKIVFSTDRLGGVSAGNAGDVLSSVPLVSVDKDGNVSLRGQAANVLVDGKPSPFSDVASTLQMIQASAIDKVEVIPNPSAKYDAQGQGGIVNIILKKNTEQGFHGLVNLDASTLPDEHAGIDAGYRHKGLHLYGNVNYHTRTIDGRQTIDQYFTNPDSSYDLSQEAQVHTQNNDVDTRIGLDLAIDSNTTLSISQAYADHKVDRSTYNIIDSGYAPQEAYTIAHDNTNTRTANRNYSTTAEIVHHFRHPGDQIDASVTYANNRIASTASLQNATADSLFQENSSGISTPRLWTAQIDYVHAIGQSTLEAGYKGDYRSGNSDVTAYTAINQDTEFAYSPLLSSRFTESSSVQALYAIWSGQAKRWHYSAGLRAEYAGENGLSYLQAGSIHRHYFNLFPSAFLLRDLTDDQTIGATFTTRIARPTFDQLLPYIDNHDPLNYTSGNPELYPAYTRHFELTYSHNYSASGNFLSLSTYYSQTSNNIQPVTQKDSTGFTLTRPENIGRSDLAGADLILRLRVGHAIHITSTIDGSYTSFPQQTGYWGASLKLTGEASLPARSTILVHGELSTPQALPQGYSNDIKGLDLEIRRPFWHNRLTTALILSDVLDDREQSTHIQTTLFTQQERYKENSRMLHLHISYRL